MPIPSAVVASDARAATCAGFREGSETASRAATSGITDIAMSARSMPKRSAIMPTSGTVRPPVPHAKPIINDDTVAALIGAMTCANVTLTGSVDWSRNPPIGEHDDEQPPVEQWRNRQERH